MRAARGSYCGEFPQPRIPFRPQPFFGSYSTTGSARGTTPSFTTPQATPGTPTAPSDGSARDGAGTDGRGTDAPKVPDGSSPSDAGGQRFPPSQYDSPPQPDPTVPLPPGLSGDGGDG
jgi:penicillin-binding protein 1A